MSQKEKKKIKINWINIITAITSVCLVVGLWYYSWLYIDENFEKEQRGIFGDKFGAINALFSGLAFAGIIFTILLQSKELRLQREELEETRNVFIEQNKMISQQKFENTFFQMLNLFHSIVNSIDHYEHKGRDCFGSFYERFWVSVSRINENGLYKISDNLSEEGAIDAYEKIYDEFKSDLSHYFRTLYHIYKFIDKSKIDDKRQYTSIVRAQLSSYEQILLFYNCLHENGIEKFKPLIEKYTVFKNLDRSLLLKPEHIKLYAKGAYKNIEDD